MKYIFIFQNKRYENILFRYNFRENIGISISLVYFIIIQIFIQKVIQTTF